MNWSPEQQSLISELAIEPTELNCGELEGLLMLYDDVCFEVSINQRPAVDLVNTRQLIIDHIATARRIAALEAPIVAEFNQRLSDVFAWLLEQARSGQITWDGAADLYFNCQETVRRGGIEILRERKTAQQIDPS